MAGVSSGIWLAHHGQQSHRFVTSIEPDHSQPHEEGQKLPRICASYRAKQDSVGSREEHLATTMVVTG